MKLSIEQISLIEETLVLNGLNFDDIKLEVTDHIASEIEVLMEENVFSFEENLHSILESWKAQLRPSFSGLIGFANPKIVTDKCHKTAKIQLFSVIGIASFVTLSLMVLVRNSSYEVALTNFQLVLKLICIAEFCLVILAWVLIWKSKRQTTYSYMLKKKTFGMVLFLFMIGIGLFPSGLNIPDGKIAFVSHFFAIAYLLMAGFYLQLAYKHLQFEKKYSISNL